MSGDIFGGGGGSASDIQWVEARDTAHILQTAPPHDRVSWLKMSKLLKLGNCSRTVIVLE